MRRAFICAAVGMAVALSASAQDRPAAPAQQDRPNAAPPAGQQDKPGQTRPGTGTDRPGVGVGGQERPGASGQVPGRPGTGEAGKSGTAGANQFLRGSIVSVDPTGNTITLRTGTGDAAREQQFRVNADTKFFGSDRQALTDGLRFNGLRAGTDVWFRAGTGDNATMLSNLSLFDPSVNAPGQNKDRDNNRDKDKGPDKE